MCCACEGGGIVETCSDTHIGLTDTSGDGCDWYIARVSACGMYDDEKFSAKTMCCACGGGTHWERSKVLELIENIKVDYRIDNNNMLDLGLILLSIIVLMITLLIVCCSFFCCKCCICYRCTKEEKHSDTEPGNIQSQKPATEEAQAENQGIQSIVIEPGKPTLILPSEGN